MYLKISQFLNSLDRRPRVNAFTATATDRVKIDIIKLLELNKPYMVKTDFDRPNLYFAVESPKSRKKAAIKWYFHFYNSLIISYNSFTYNQQMIFISHPGSMMPHLQDFRSCQYLP